MSWDFRNDEHVNTPAPAILNGISQHHLIPPTLYSDISKQPRGYHIHDEAREVGEVGNFSSVRWNAVQVLNDEFIVPPTRYASLQVRDYVSSSGIGAEVVQRLNGMSAEVYERIQKQLGRSGFVAHSPSALLK
jgi:hypothetical protein